MAKTRATKKTTTAATKGLPVADGGSAFKQEETLDGTIMYNVPFPTDLRQLKSMAPIVVKHPYQIDYLHSYGQDSPFFAGLANKKILGTKCPKCGYAYATPKFHCMYDGAECKWVEVPQEGRIHCFTICHFGSEEFLDETPFCLILVEFEGFNTLFLSRLMGVDLTKPSLDWVGMKVKAKFKRLSKFKPTDVYFVPA